MSGFYLSDDIPEIFKAADRYMEEKNPQPKYIDMTREDPIPGLEFDTNPRIEGPIKFTEEYYKKAVARQKKERKESNEKRINGIKVELTQLCAQKRMLEKQLGQLDIGKKKDSKRIAAINVHLDRINARIKEIEEVYKIKAKELNTGSKVQRVVTTIKKTFKKAKKKVKKFFRKNEELIVGLASIVLPIISVAIMKFIN